MPPGQPDQQAGPVVVWTVLLALLAYAAAGLVASFVPVSVMADRLGSLSGAGDAGPEIGRRYAALVVRARMTSLLLLAGWVVLVWRRRWLAGLLGAVAAHAAAWTRTAPGRTVRAARRAWTLHRTETVLFLAVALAGMAIRLAYLGRDMRHDETWTFLNYARRPLYLIPLLFTSTNHHPLNSLLVHVSVSVFGTSPQAIRLPAFLFGVGCVPAAYLLVRSRWGAGAALIAASLVAGSTSLIEYSVNARGYSAVVLFGLLVLWAGQRALRRSALSVGGAAWGSWALVVLFGVLGAYANIVMLLPLLVAFTWFGLLCLAGPAPGRWPRLLQAVVAGAAILIGILFTYLPFFTTSGWDAITGSEAVKSTGTVAASVAEMPGFVRAVVDLWSTDLFPGVGTVLLLLATVAWLLARQDRRAAWTLLVGLASPLAFQFILVRDGGPERIWLPILAVLLVLSAIAMDGIVARLVPAVRLAGSSLVALLLLTGALVAVVRGGTVLDSMETGYFPQAQVIAADLTGRHGAAMTSADRLIVTAVRGDEVVYYALRDGVAIEPVSTSGSLRLYRRVDGAQAPTGSLIMVFDTVLPLCRGAACVTQARALATFSSPALVREAPGYVELRAPLSR